MQQVLIFNPQTPNLNLDKPHISDVLSLLPLIIIYRTLNIQIIPTTIIISLAIASSQFLALSQIIAFNFYSIYAIQLFVINHIFRLIIFKEWWYISLGYLMLPMQGLPSCIRIESLVHLLSEFFTSREDLLKIRLAAIGVLIFINVYYISLVFFILSNPVDTSLLLTTRCCIRSESSSSRWLISSWFFINVKVQKVTGLVVTICVFTLIGGRYSIISEGIINESFVLLLLLCHLLGHLFIFFK